MTTRPTAIRDVISAICRSSEDQELLFDQILMGQLEFPLPYWDNVSETAKVTNTLIFFTGFTARSDETDELLCFPAQGAD